MQRSPNLHQGALDRLIVRHAGRTIGDRLRPKDSYSVARQALV
jgi:hypothetical protein